MGYVAAAIATKALLDIKGDITQKSVNEAFKNVEGLRDRHPLQAVVLGR